MPYVVTDECMLCGVCIAGCPTESITEGETKCFIDVSQCIECGTCAENCPSEAIIFLEEEDSEDLCSDRYKELFP
jgi:ferredoxin